jgi:hypothetical protein
MVMGLFWGMCHPDPQYSTVSIREAKYTHLGYRIRLSMLHTLDPPFSIIFSEERPFNTPDPKQENNQGTPDKLLVLDVSYAGLQEHEIINVALHQEYSPGITFIFS